MGELTDRGKTKLPQAKKHAELTARLEILESKFEKMLIEFGKHMGAPFLALALKHELEDGETKCCGFGPMAECGNAINYCYDRDDGTKWAGNGEYESQVNFCPYCGDPARTKIKEGEDEDGS